MHCAYWLGECVGERNTKVRDTRSWIIGMMRNVRESKGKHNWFLKYKGRDNDECRRRYWDYELV
jgi:hypothetical protein